MSAESPETTNSTDTTEDIDPTTDKNPAHWTAECDPLPDYEAIFFTNENIGYGSYDPPRGFTAEEIMQFNGAKDCLTLEQVNELIKERDEKGTLTVTGDDRWK